MAQSQTALLFELAKELAKQENSKELVIKSLHEAGIVNINGKISKKFPNLDRFATSVK
jgi:Na+-translocating ferredoxin:NAD+ oxidoreductase RnfC subunit